jgi:carbamate kinase
MTLEDAERYYREGHFPPGNMGPKILASIRFLRGGGRAAYIGSLGSIKDLMMGNTGTIIEP